MRLSIYILTFQLLFFYIVGEWSWAHAALLQLGIYSSILHIVNIGYGLCGLLDQYTLTVMVNEALLTNAPLFHMVFRHSLQKTKTHRALYISNVILSTFEILASAGSLTGSQSSKLKKRSNIAKAISTWISRNKQFCPELEHGLEVAQLHRVKFTTYPCVVGIILALTLYAVYKIDVRHNRGKQFSDWDSFRPSSLVWKVNSWTPQRIRVSIIAIVVFALSIFNLEYFIIADFHRYMRQFPQISSNENGWAYGQLIPLGTAFAAFCYAFRTYLVAITTKAEQELGITILICC